MRDWMSTLALVNGTAGGIVLVLPIIGLEAGWLMIPLIIGIASLSCYYTAVIMFRHLGKTCTINQSIMNHFKSSKYCLFYNLVMFLSFFGEMLIYFDLLVAEIQGALYQVTISIKDCFPYLTAIFLIALVLLARKFHFEDDLLGYGILSMIAFCVFIAWILIDRQDGPYTIPAINDRFVDLAAAMSQGYSIHNMMIPVILRAQNPQNYRSILLNVFLIAGILYTFISYGSFAIVNRHPEANTQGQTVEDYFSVGQWEIFLLRGIYIINIITVFPGFLSYSRIRFFNLFQKQQPRQTPMSIKQIVYYVGIIGICMLANVLRLKAQTVIQLNGAIICFVEIYFIPLAIHIKCIWWDFKQTQQLQLVNGGTLRDFPQNNFQMGVITKHEQVKQKKVQQQQRQNICYQICPCHQEVANKHKRYNQIAISFVVLGWGLLVMVYTLVVMFQNNTLRK